MAPRAGYAEAAVKGWAMHGLLGILALVAVLAAASPASAYVGISGVFVPDRQCPAFDSIRRETNPGTVLTVPGEAYAVRGLNREDGDFVHLDVPGAVPRARWVSLSCGELRRAPGPAPERPADSAGALKPFFDEVEESPDPAPRPPVLGAFDRAVLEVCGPWGSRPSATAFRAMLDDPAVSEEVGQIYQALDGRILGRKRDPARFKDELTAVWFEEEGFRHVFCGEPSDATLGGLHFAGRYLQLQQQGLAGIAPDCDRTEIEPPVYTLGILFRAADGRMRTACPKGYGLNLDAREIIVAATRALILMRSRGAGEQACLHKVEEAGEPSYLAVFVVRNGAVRTFFPDASPSCGDGRPARSCLCAR